MPSTRVGQSADNAAQSRRSRPLGAVLAAVLALFALPLSAAGDHILIHNYRLHIDCVGEGTPTVVLDAGLGGSSLEWVYVRDRLSPWTKVCVFDRAGYGRSDMGPLPRTSSHIANELYLLLDGAGISAPYIVVGHSFGGYNTQLFARRYAYLTAGLVLIDASHPEQVERFLAPPLNMLTAPSSRYGIVQFRDPPPPHEQLPAAIKGEIALRAKHWKTRRTLGGEMLGFRDSAEQVRSAQSLGSVPLLVVSRGKRDQDANEKRLLMEKLWLEMQTELAASSVRSAHLLARGSGHHVHIEQPQLVAYSIALLVNRARQLSPHHDQPMVDLNAFTVRDYAWLSDSLKLRAERTDHGDDRLAWCRRQNATQACLDGAP